MASDTRILITGAGGFVGTWLRRCLKTDARVRALVVGTTISDVASRDQDGTVWRSLDLRDAEAVDGLVAAVKPTVVVHLAAQAHVQESLRFPDLTWSTNLNGTMNLAQAVLRHTPKCRFIFVSSSEIYGGSFRYAGVPLNETALLDPENPYAASKAAADLLIGQMARQGLQSLRLRPFNHSGPRQSEQFVVPAFASQVVRIERGEQNPVISVGNLEALRDFLDVRDVVSAYAAAVLRPEPFTPGLILNLASGFPRRIGSILEALVSKSKARIRIEIDPGKFRPNDTPFAAGDAGQARKKLDWQPNIAWDQTLDDILADLRNRPAKETAQH